MMKSLLRRIAPGFTFFLRLFFEKKYLNGQYFTGSLVGCRWALKALWVRNVLRLAPALPWPAVHSCHVSNPRNIIFHPDDLNNFQSPGTYFQNFKAVITLGRGTYIGPNVGIITANHDLDDLAAHASGQDVTIGEGCWLGMNSVILPGVVLGARTIVAAGAVVTHSFPDGGVVIGGVPAKVLKAL
jgi:hypothetical protein